jgi:N-acetylglucosamine-6-phosphate deacetylase
VRDASGALAGSALTMLTAAANYLRMVPGADAAALGRVAAANPARLAGAAGRFGSIAPGRVARFAVLQPDGRLGLQVAGPGPVEPA